MNTNINPAKLRAVRRERGLTQQDLAELAGVSARTVQRVECGRPALADTLLRVAKGLQVSPDQLLVREPSSSARPHHAGSHVVLVASTKRGTGRTTLAFHLAGWLQEAGYRVCLLDFNRVLGVAQHVAWAQALQQPVPIHVPETGPMEAARRLAGLRQGFDIVVIDTSGHEDADLLPLALMTDQILLTTDHPRVDFGIKHRVKMWLNATIIHDKISIVRTKASRYESHRRQDVAFLQTIGLPWCKTVLQARAAYEYALGRGQTVTRDDPTGKAATEIRQLGHELGWGRDRPSPDRPLRASRDRRHTKEDRMYLRACTRMGHPPAVLARIIAGQRPNS